MPATYEFISKVVADGSSYKMTISNIPQTYTDLVFVGDVIFNGDNIMELFANSTNQTNNFSYEYFWWDPNTANTGKVNNGELPRIARTNGLFKMDVLDYTNSDKYKCFQLHNAADRSDSGAASNQWAIGTIWTFSPITSFTFANYYSGNTWAAGSSISVFGIKKA